MASDFDDDKDEKPLDPAMLRVQARLKRMIAISGSTLGLGLLAVVIALIYRASHSSSDAAPRGAAWASSVEIATKGSVVGTSISGNQLAVTVNGPEGQVVEIFHMPSGKPIGTVRLLSK